MITKFSKNNSNKQNNEYYNLESIFEKFILCMGTCQKPGDAQQESKHQFSAFPIIRLICFRMSSKCFRRLLIGFNSVVAYKRNFFRNLASKNSREALGIRNAFSNIDITHHSISFRSDIQMAPLLSNSYDFWIVPTFKP